MRLKRPHVPLSTRIKVAARQLVESGKTLELIDACQKGVRENMNGANYLALVLHHLFGGEAIALDHNPALALRKRRKDGSYVPPANDPRYLIYRSKEGHDTKTRHRGDSGQFSDLALVRRQKKRLRKRTKVGKERNGRRGRAPRGSVGLGSVGRSGARSGLAGKGAGRMRRPASRRWPKRKWPSRPLRSRRSAEDTQ